jgi:serine/threonine-protein phosphatase CPPED1
VRDDVMHFQGRLLFCVLLLAAITALAAPDGDFFFIQLSDPQFGMYEGDKGYEQETANYEFAIATANRLKPAFVIVTGDLVNKSGDPGQVSEYLRVSKKLLPSIPIYHLPGNHDVGNEPSPESLAAYRRSFGRDYYSFRSGPLYAIVLDSALIKAPQNTPREAAEQESWLRSELEKASGSGEHNIVVFQHHPYFVDSPVEKDEYHNIPGERRRAYLDLLRSHGVRWVFAGHYHQNALANDGDLQMITTGPVGHPLGRGKSGIRIVAVTGAWLKHRFFDFGDLPPTLAEALKQM